MILIALLFIFSSPILAQEALCNYRFNLPQKSSLTNKGFTSYIAKKTYRYRSQNITFEWNLNCNKNFLRTSQISNIIAKIEKEKDIIRYHEKVQLEQGIKATIISRTQIYKGRRIHSITSYFATRDYEYFIYIIPKKLVKKQSLIEIPKPIQAQIIKEIKKLLKNTKFNKQYGKVQATITEAQYQSRLRISLIIIASIIFLSIFIVFCYYKYYKRAKKSYLKNHKTSHK